MDVIVTMIIAKIMLNAIAEEDVNIVLRAHKDHKDR